MASTRLRLEDRLEVVSIILPWKVRVTLLLKEHDLWGIMEKVVPIPTYTTLKENQEKKGIET